MTNSPIDSLLLLDHPVISARYFFPRPSVFKDPIYLPTPEGEIACWRSSAPSSRPILVHFHGNGEVVSDWIDLFGPLCQAMGYDVFLAEYRGYGMSSGTPKLGSMLDDVSRVADALGVPTSQTVVFGRSVGSIYALEWISRFPDTRGVVIESGIHDVLQRLLLRLDPSELGSTLDALTQAAHIHLNHTTKLSTYQNPSLFMHAEHDHLVTVDHAQTNAKASQHGELVVFPRGDHNSIFGANVDDYLRTLSTFLKRVSP